MCTHWANSSPHSRLHSPKAGFKSSSKASNLQNSVLSLAQHEDDRKRGRVGEVRTRRVAVGDAPATQDASPCCCGTNGHGFRPLKPRECTFLQSWRPRGQSRCHWAPGKMSLGLDQGATRSSPSLPREPAALLGSWLHCSNPASVVTWSSPLEITFWAHLRHPDSLSPNHIFTVPFFYVR